MSYHPADNAQSEDTIEDTIEVESNEQLDDEEPVEDIKETEIVNPAPKTNTDKIVEVLKKNPQGLKAWQIASEIGLSKKEVNRILYKNHNIFISDTFVWKIK